MRILVFGSRTWRDMDKVFKAIIEVAIPVTGSVVRNTDITIVHGGADGADALASDLCQLWHVKEEVHLPNYDKHSDVAPLFRNTDMARSRLDVALGFINPCAKPGCKRVLGHDSHGSTDMLTKLAHYNVPTVVYREGVTRYGRPSQPAGRGTADEPSTGTL
jgi:YspA, cpYpsA-related SLOG family